MLPFWYKTKSRMHLSTRLSVYIQLVTPSVVPIAVKIDTKICTINFHVSRFIILNSSLKQKLES